MAKSDLQGTLDLMVRQTLAQSGFFAQVWCGRAHSKGSRFIAEVLLNHSP